MIDAEQLIAQAKHVATKTHKNLPASDINEHYTCMLESRVRELCKLNNELAEFMPPSYNGSGNVNILTDSTIEARTHRARAMGVPEALPKPVPGVVRSNIDYSVLNVDPCGFKPDMWSSRCILEAGHQGMHAFPVQHYHGDGS